MNMITCCNISLNTAMVKYVQKIINGNDKIICIENNLIINSSLNAVNYSKYKSIRELK